MSLPLLPSTLTEQRVKDYLDNRLKRFDKIEGRLDEILKKLEGMNEKLRDMKPVTTEQFLAAMMIMWFLILGSIMLMTSSVGDRIRDAIGVKSSFEKRTEEWERASNVRAAESKVRHEQWLRQQEINDKKREATFEEIKRLLIERNAQLAIPHGDTPK